jgi:serine protease Do
VATVWNHVLDTDGLAAVLSDGRRFSAKVVGYEPQLDLAVIKLDADDLDLPYFDLKEAVSVGPGTRILGFSNMFKVATGDEPMSVIHGVIASRTRLTARRGAYSVPYDGLVYIVDAVTNNSGSTGGVITTRDGRLVGMIGKELRNRMSNTWINYAMPVTELREPIAQIISGDYTTRSKPENAQNPGRYSPLDFGLVMVPDVLYRTPAYIDSVLSGSQAGRAGLQPDDLVLFVNDKLIQSYRDLASALGHLEAGDPCRLTVRRNAELISVELQAERKPAG